MLEANNCSVFVRAETDSWFSHNLGRKRPRGISWGGHGRGTLDGRQDAYIVQSSLMLTKKSCALASSRRV